MAQNYSSTKSNPSENKLNSGITISDVDQAIKKSGYPLQTIISNQLRPDFFCQEEWSFIDTKTKELRSLDIMAVYRLSKETETESIIRPTLNLLIECKQSELPYVFFLSPDKIETPEYPYISGLFNREVVVSTDSSSSRWITPVINLLSLDQDDFLSKTPKAMTFSKCVRSGKEVVLSGTESYHGLILPLIKSLQYFSESERPPKSAKYFDAHLPFAIGVIDGPMIGVTINGDSHVSEFMPWIRVFRHEAYESEDLSERQKVFAVDVVHKSFFNSFLYNHLLPFAQKYSGLLLKHQKEIASGKAFIKGMDENFWGDIELRLSKK